MNTVNWLVTLYFIVILVLVNCSLLFCNEKHCIYPFEKLPISKETAYYIRVGISNLIPVGFKNIQLFAQWLILAEAVVLFYFVLKLLRRIVSFVCDIIFLVILLALAYIVYL